MNVAIKIMMFRGKKNGGHYVEDDEARQMVLREAALCCSMAHANVVATYHFEVVQASAFHVAPSGLSITDNSDVGDFKLYLVQVLGSTATHKKAAWLPY